MENGQKNIKNSFSTLKIAIKPEARDTIEARKEGFWKIKENFLEHQGSIIKEKEYIRMDKAFMIWIRTEKELLGSLTGFEILSILINSFFSQKI